MTGLPQLRYIGVHSNLIFVAPLESWSKKVLTIFRLRAAALTRGKAIGVKFKVIFLIFVYIFVIV